MAFNEQITAYFGGDTTKFDQALRSMSVSVRAKGKEIASGFMSSIAATASVGGLVAAFEKAAGLADKLRRSSEGLGVSTDFLQGFFSAARNNGSSEDAAQTALDKLAEKIGAANEEGGEAAQVFEKWGIALTNANGTAKNTEEVTRAISDKMAATADGTTRAAMAVDFFGKKGAELIPTLQGGSAALDEFIDKTNKLSEEDIKFLDDLKDKLDEAGKSAVVTAGKLISSLGGAIDKIRNKQVTPDQAKSLATNLAKLAIPGIGPWLAGSGTIDAVAGIGADNSGKGLSVADAKAKSNRADATRFVKQMAQEFAEQKRIQEQMRKAEAEAGNIGETNAAKVARLTQEASDLREKINHDEFKGIEFDQKRLELQNKENELKKAAVDLGKEQAAQDEKRKKAQEDVVKAEKDLKQAQQDRRTFTLSQLAGEGLDFDAGSGVRGASNRRRARRGLNRFLNNVSQEEADARAIAQQIQDAEGSSDFLARAGHFRDAQSQKDLADQLRASLPAEFASLADRDPLHQQIQQLEEMNKKLDGVLNVKVENAAQ